MTGALKVVIVMLAVPLVYAGLLLQFQPPLALWGAVFLAGFLGISLFHRIRKRRLYIPYIIIWAVLLGGLWYASGSSYCASDGDGMKLPAILCPFP